MCLSMLPFLLDIRRGAHRFAMLPYELYGSLPTQQDCIEQQLQESCPRQSRVDTWAVCLLTNFRAEMPDHMGSQICCRLQAKGGQCDRLQGDTSMHACIEQLRSGALRFEGKTQSAASGAPHQMTIISLKVRRSSSRENQLCSIEKGNTKAARPSMVRSRSTQKSHTVSPKYVFCGPTETQSLRTDL